MGVPGGGFSHWKNSSTTDIDSWRCDIDNPRRCSSDDSDIPSRQGKFSSRSSPGCALHDDFSPFPPLNEHASQQTLSPAVTILNYLNALAERSTDLPIARDSQAISPDQHILCKPPNGSLHLPDMIGAVLYNHSPRSLEAFLIRDDDKIFHFHRRSQNGPGQLEFGIVRESNIVTVSRPNIFYSYHSKSFVFFYSPNDVLKIFFRHLLIPKI